MSGKTVRTLQQGIGSIWAGASGDNQPLGVQQMMDCVPVWTSLGIPASQVLDLTRTMNGVWLAATYGEGAYRSTDEGSHWQPANRGLEDSSFYSLEVHPTDGNIVLIASESQGAYRSTDAGLTWERRSPDGVDETNVVTFDAANGDIAFIGGNGQGIYRSTDGGQHFRESNDGLTDRVVWRIVSAPSAASVVYAGTNSGVFRSTDSGVHWQAAGLGGTRIRALVVHPGSAGWVYAGGSNGSVWRTTDSGETWNSITANLPGGRAVYDLLLDTRRCNMLMAGTTDGIYRYAFGEPVTPTPTPTATSTPMPILIRGTSTPIPTLTSTPTPIPTPTPPGGCPQGIVSGALSTSDPTFGRAVGAGGACYVSSGPYHYDVYTYYLHDAPSQQLLASLCDSYGGSATYDTVLILYQAPNGEANPFNPASACTHAVAYNDDYCGLRSQIEMSGLVPGFVQLVITSFSSGTTGNYEMNIVSETCQQGDSTP